MINVESWKPSKFVFSKGKLKASSSISIMSRLMTNLIGKVYTNGLSVYAKGQLLDLGCGSVPMYLAYKEKVESVTCVDWSNSAHNISHLDFQMDLNEVLDLADQSFDTILLSDVLEHIRKPQQLINEISRMLKMEGILIMNVPFYYWLHEKPFDFYRYTQYALKELMKEAGLEVLELKEIGGSPEILADILMKHLHVIPFVGKLMCYFIHYVTWGFIQTSIGRRVSKKTAKNFPYGYFLVAKKKI